MHQNPIRPPPEGGCQLLCVDVSGRVKACFYSVFRLFWATVDVGGSAWKW